MATTPKPEEKKGMLDSYYEFVDKKDESGGRTRLWANNVAFFGLGYVVRGLMDKPKTA